MGSKKNVGVLAGNYMEYKNFINFNIEAQEIVNFIYIDNFHKIVGIELEEVITIGTFYKNDRWNELFQEAKMRIRIRD